MNKLIVFSTIFLISSCSISPGMHMSENTSWLSEDSYVYIDSLKKELKIENINSSNINRDTPNTYKIGKGDQIAITVWGIPEVFPQVSINTEQNLRRVDSNGNIFFPYVGSIQAIDKTETQLRQDITLSLSSNFNNPQLDVSIARFNSQRIYLLGEVTRPTRINITDVPLSLAEALGQASGLNINSSNASQVYIIRQDLEKNNPRIFRADLSSPSSFIDAGRFYLKDNDIVYVNSKGTTRWNRVISQFFPFSSFLNSVDNLVDSN